MLETLLELALEVGGEAAELLAGWLLKKKKQERRRPKNLRGPAEPWERGREKPPWEG
ncbi:MAG: hypothetical protein HFF39_03085 [Lawsonibacter sp.]|nr:hypothetical protein [Lawsonibacter sp.]